MNVIATLKEKFGNLRAERRELQQRNAGDYWAMVHAITDGGEPSVDELHTFISGAETPGKAVCPRNANHTQLREQKRGKHGETRFVCDDCGSEWKQEAVLNPQSADSRKTVDELENDVQLILKRREWAALQDERVDVEKQMADIQAELDEANERVVKAITSLLQ